MPKKTASQPRLMHDQAATYDATPEPDALAHLRRPLTKEELDKVRHIEGFPIGADEDIIALSDPPYYTACPNPFLEDFIKAYGKPYDEATDTYHREPFAFDVSEGKNDPIYNAHSYHTKVPHKAIMRYILHYTEPGDVVFDGFCGTGMTGVAAQMCANPDPEFKAQIEAEMSGVKWGARRAVLSDLSPASTFIAHNYVSMTRLREFEKEAMSVIEKVEESLAWLYQDELGAIANAIWSDVFVCPNCTREIVYWKAAVVDGALEKSFPCPHCGSMVGKATSKENDAVKLERAFETRFDPVLRKPVRIPRFVLVQQTVVGPHGKETVAASDKKAEAILELLTNKEWPSIPTDEFFPGRQTNKLIHGTGISHICHMYTLRALYALGWLWQQQLSSREYTQLFRFCLTGINNYISRKQGYFGGGGGVAGTLFTPSLHIERNVFDVLLRKVKSVSKLSTSNRHTSIVSTQSITDVQNLPDGSIDYIFTDPPFGESIQYAELNLFVEAWLGVRTVAEQDCVLNYVHRKDLAFYSTTMSRAFQQYARVLKPGRWITIEFHNSQNAVWNAIQQAVESSGLVVADVRVLDKQQRSFNAVNRVGAVDQDLVISAYTPRTLFEQRFREEAGTEQGAWDFIRQHLAQLPVFVEKNGAVEVIAERQNYLLFDRMVAFHIQRGASVPLSAAEFYAGLRQRFPERDGMYFLPEQVAEYDTKRAQVAQVEQLSLFVSDEKSAVQWLRTQLESEPQTYQDIQPKFLQELHQARHEKMPELRQLLEENFLKDDEDRWYVPDPAKAEDLEKLRERGLLREFAAYVESKGRLKTFRTEAVRAGFKSAWGKRDYAMIIEVARRLPEDVLQEDPALLMYYDNAVMRSGVR